MSSCRPFSLTDSVLVQKQNSAPIALLEETDIQHGAPQRKTYADFLEAILTYESTIDTQKGLQYQQEYYSGAIVTDYPDVEYPGRVVRDESGNYITGELSLKTYFRYLGIDGLYNPNSTDPNMLKTMKYAVVNFLGFIGYQFSESDLQVLGYYNYHYDDEGHPMYYVDLPNSTWAHGVREKVLPIKQPDGSIIDVRVTDVNRWGGTFTGKNGINSLDDFKTAKADAIAKDHFVYKRNNIVKLLAKAHRKIEDYIGTTLYWNKLTPKLTPPPGVPNAVKVTYSGLLAGAHLRGAEGVYELLVEHKNPQDELGTAILLYLYEFRGYQTPWGRDF